MVFFVAKLAAHFYGLPCIDHLLQVFLSNTDQRPLNSLFGTVAMVLCGNRIHDLKAKFSQKLLKDLLRCHSLIQHGCDRSNLT